MTAELAQEAHLTLLHALQIAGLIPCLFLVILVAALTRDSKRWLVPAAYFLSLACGFMMMLWPATGWNSDWFLLLALAETAQPALCFLMVIQCLNHRPPAPVFWLLIALPLLGGSSMVYALSLDEQLCFKSDYCVDGESLHVLYQMFAACAVFLLLIMQINRITDWKQPGNAARAHIYWLMIALIGLNLCLFGFDLAWIAGHLDDDKHRMIITVLRIGFIYLVMTSLFRVFERGASSASATRYRDKPVAAELIDNIKELMDKDKAYREMGFSREALAAKLEVGEHVISKAINQHFGKNFNEYVNGFRIEEAKSRLQSELTPITVIAFEVGFSSIASFNRVFKAAVGMSPTEYRAANSA